MKNVLRNDFKYKEIPPKLQERDPYHHHSWNFQLDCSPSLPTEPHLRLEAAKSTTGKLNVVLLHVVPHTINFVTSRDVARRPTT